MKPLGILQFYWTGWRLVLVFLLWAGAAGAGSATEDSTAAAEVAFPGDTKSIEPEAETAAENAGPKSVEPPGPLAVDSMGESLFAMTAKLAVGLGVVIFLVWSSVWLLRKSALGQKFGATGNTIQVLERSFLAPKKSIYLVEIGGRILALGVSEENIALLAEWQVGELELSAPNSSSPGSFATQLKTLLGQSDNAVSTRGE